VLDRIDPDSAKPAEIRRLAEEALEIDPACCDAWVRLARLEENEERVRRCLEKAVQVGREKHRDLIDSPPWKDHADHPGLWGFGEARPFLLALYELGDFHRESGRYDEARATFEEILRLSPGDNLGVRHDLLALLTSRNEIDAAEALLDRFAGDPSCPAVYTRALVHFRRAMEGASIDETGSADDSGAPFSALEGPDLEAARAALAEAVGKWPWAVPFLLDPRSLMVAPFTSVVYGSPEEALEFARLGSFGWVAHPVLIQWLAFEGLDQLESPEAKAAMKKRHETFVALLAWYDEIEVPSLGEADFGGDPVPEEAGALEALLKKHVEFMKSYIFAVGEGHPLPNPRGRRR